MRMLWFTFKVIFETIPIGWLCGGGGGPKVIIKLTQSSLAGAWNIYIRHEKRLYLSAKQV